MPHLSPHDLEPRQFSRVFRILERFFPGSQIGNPSVVHPTLQMVAEVMRPSFLHDARMRVDDQAVATGGATTTITHPEPDLGFVHLPMLWAVDYDGAANISADARMDATASTPLDPWGRWTSGNTFFATVRVQGSLILLPCFPYGRGNQLSVRFNGPAPATTVVARLFFVQVPGELCDLQTWSVRFGNFVQTRALP